MPWDYDQFPQYVSAAEKKRLAEQQRKRLERGGHKLEPAQAEPGKRAIAKTFWGAAWCQHLEQHCDFDSRLERGRSYIRNGSVIHLAIAAGKVAAKVSGSELYDVEITITPLQKKHWEAVKRECTGQIGSMLELLKGQLSTNVLGALTNPERGTFPKPGEMDFACTCPDQGYSGMCKHVAATLYGVGVRLDQKPQLLFTLRAVDEAELLSAAPVALATGGKAEVKGDLSALFGIDLDEPGRAPQPVGDAAVTPKVKRATAKKTAAHSKTNPTPKRRAAATAPRGRRPRIRARTR